MKTELIILGCGNSIGVPTINGNWGNCDKKNKKNFRTRCSAVLLKGSNIVLIDTSPDIRHQMIQNKIRNVSSVIYTHDHADQTNGLFELRPFSWSKKEKINIYANSETIKSLKNRFDYCFKSMPSYPAIVKSHLIKKNFSLGHNNEKINIKTLQVRHGRIFVTAYIINKTAYISDCNDKSIATNKNFQNLQYLIIDCIRIIKSPLHFNLV